MRRFIRLTNAFSKKVEYHADAVTLRMIYSVLVRTHKILRITPRDALLASMIAFARLRMSLS